MVYFLKHQTEPDEPVIMKKGSLLQKNRDRKSWNETFQRLNKGKGGNVAVVEVDECLDALEAIAFPNSFITNEVGSVSRMCM
jgi:hypothetical protein